MNIFRQSFAFLYCLLALAPSVFSQEWTTFLPQTGTPVIKSMPDGNLYVAESRSSVDTLTVYKITPSGQVLWESNIKSGGLPQPGGNRKNGCVGIFPDANGSVKLVTHSATVWAGITFSQLDGSGNEIWRFDTLNPGSGWTLDAVRDDNGDFVLTRNYGKGITKFDADGHFKFLSNISGGGGNWTQSICKTDDGGYLIACDWFYTGNVSKNVLRMNSQGDTLASYKMPCASSDNLVCKGSDGKYCMVGYTQSGICWKVFQLDGTTIAEYSLPVSEAYLYDVVAVPNGYVIGGKRSNQATIWRLNLAGDLIFERSFFPGENSIFRGLTSVPGSQLVYATGWTQPTPAASSNVFAMCIDATLSETLGLLTGTVRADDEADCAADPSDEPFEKVPVAATSGGETFYTLTDANGNYRFWLEAGDWAVEAIAGHPYWEPCSGPQTVTVLPNDTVSADFWMQKLYDCPLMEVNIATWSLIRCFSTYYNVNYCNLGTAAAEDAQITVVMDPFQYFISSDPAPTSINGDSLVYDLGDVPSGFCGAFQIELGMDCPETQTGQTLCVSAHVTPDSICGDYANWSGASMAVNALCDGDSVRLRVWNRGNASTSQPIEYVITEDDVILMQGEANFSPGEETVVAYPANGSTWRIESEQENGHPGLSHPAQSIEGCVSNPSMVFSLGFINMFPLDDGDLAHDIYCGEVRASCDPNDKEGFPVGYGSERLIERGTDLEYLIRFQNTGTAPAFTVVIRDTLPESLNPASIRIGSASHDFTWSLEGRGILVLRFDNILLPDSSSNEPASHGWATFRISQKPDLPLGTEIQNRVGIYFDFNDPVITNLTYHKIGENFIKVVSVEGEALRIENVKISPNPAVPGTWLFFEKTDFNGLTFRLFDAFGKEISMEKIKDGRVLLPGVLHTGTFVFRVENASSGAVLGRGKLLASRR